uniref:Reverse transcriptase Ty1/copia-type domain-containing protein n=1 Tax=Chromera velia CCMP2878 TaxID=1169474 RepID=A0A0G4F7U5_9ALVE|eukprot:Cvel_15666.t1-p1 / transcript=Cvel_15666.t1 / gene=Cvel_15666 / organism=Chromera_velia_CCMP2878 / gene_product=hypothetical protein / transcript_product=hypothetical protein / location=Cvel_scaffold1169:38124-39011(-) / protein_length=296 / sequence_SO=supercontig / SO=protein_coding / is_pseudo=false
MSAFSSPISVLTAPPASTAGRTFPFPTSQQPNIAQWGLRIALCIAFTFLEFNPLTSFLLADIENAYLTAPRPDSPSGEPTYVRPPPDHPEYRTHLWLLLKAVYGLKDSGFIFDHHRDRVLLEAGWMKSGVPGLWWKWSGQPGVESSRLLGLCATFVDDLAVIGIGASPSELVDEIASKGPFTITKVKADTNGCARWAGVDIELREDEIRLSQAKNVQSLLQTVPPGPILNTPLPPDSRDRLDDSPALPASQARSFRSLLGGLAWVARDTRPDLAEACNELSRSVACPTERSLLYLH